MNDNEMLLCAMILCPQELCLEKARYMYDHHIPLNRVNVSTDWITDIVKDDIQHMQQAGIKQVEIARMYCMTLSRFAHLFPTYKRGW